MEKNLSLDITRWSTPKSDWLYSLQPKMEKLYTVSKKQDRERTVARIMNSLLPNSDWNWRKYGKPLDHSVQFSLSVVSDFLHPMNRSTPGLPVHHQLPEFTQTHVHRVSDAIQPSHPLSSPSPPPPNPSEHQGLFQWVNSLHEVAKVSFIFKVSHYYCVIVHFPFHTC